MDDDDDNDDDKPVWISSDWISSDRIVVHYVVVETAFMEWPQAKRLGFFYHVLQGAQENRGGIWAAMSTA
jgi:hypothetical protein